MRFQIANLNFHLQLLLCGHELLTYEPTWQIQEPLLSFFSLPNSSIIQGHFIATLTKKIYANINSIPFPRKNIFATSDPVKALQITDKRIEDDVCDRK